MGTVRLPLLRSEAIDGVIVDDDDRCETTFSSSVASAAATSMYVISVSPSAVLKMLSRSSCVRQMAWRLRALRAFRAS